MHPGGTGDAAFSGEQGHFALRRGSFCPRGERNLSPCGASYFAPSGKVTKTLPGALRPGAPASCPCRADRAFGVLESIEKSIDELTLPPSPLPLIWRLLECPAQTCQKSLLIGLARSSSDRFVRQLSVRTARAAAAREADRSSTEKHNRLVCLNRDFPPHSRKAGVLNRSGSSGVLPSLPPWAKKVAPQGETFLFLYGKRTSRRSAKFSVSLGPEAETLPLHISRRGKGTRAGARKNPSLRRAKYPVSHKTEGKEVCILSASVLYCPQSNSHARTHRGAGEASFPCR